MTTVLAALQDSMAAVPVLTAASAVAPLFGATVDAVHVGTVTGETARACADRMGVAFRTVPGHVSDLLPELAAGDVAVVVVGSHDRLMPGAALGHVPIELADTLPRPLLVVPPHCAPAERVQRVLVALKGQPGRARPLLRALDVVAGADLDLTVVHVDAEADVPAFSESAAHEQEEYAREYLARYWPLAPRARLALPVGDAAEQVLAVADDVQPDVLVAGWRPGAGPDHGRVVRQVLRRSRWPVLLVGVA